MTKANDIQIGGTHYSKNYQHWDFIIDTNTPYLLASVSKYISRYKDKNGIEDVKKALHFIDKAIKTDCKIPLHSTEALHRFASQFDAVQYTIILSLYVNLAYSRGCIVSLINRLEFGATSPYTRG